MILDLRKSCLDAIERVMQNLLFIRTQYSSTFPKSAQQKLNLVQNDIELLKDNFTLVATKILRLQSKCSEKQTTAQKAQHKYRAKYEEVCQSYNVLQVKYQKLGKELNFIKFSNNSLRKQLQSVQTKQKSNKILRRGIAEIQAVIRNSAQNLKSKVDKIISNVLSEHDGEQDYLDFNRVDEEKATNYFTSKINNKKNQFGIESVSEFSLQKPPIKQIHVLKEERQVINSCDLKSDRDHIKTKKKLQATKQSSQFKESLSTDKKKRNELARLVQQQGRLARINERYLSTDLF